MKRHNFIVCSILSILSFFAVPLSSCSMANNIIQTEDKNIVSIAIKEGTVPEEIFINHFDEAGIKLIVNYSDDSSEEISVTTSMIPEEYKSYLTTPGKYTIAALFKDHRVSFDVRISESHYLIKFYAYGFNEEEYCLISTQNVKTSSDVVEPLLDNDFYIDGYHYTFTGWDKEFKSITTNLDVYAQYKKVEYYTVNFYNGKDELISSQKVDKGEDAVEPTEKQKRMFGYNFIGWDSNYVNINDNRDIHGLYVSTITSASISINNKNELQKEWMNDDTSFRCLDITILVNGEEINSYESLIEGYLRISSDKSIIGVSGLGIYISKNQYGTSLVTATIGDYSDSVEITITRKPTDKEVFGTEHEGTLEDPFSNEDALIAAKYLEAHGGFGSKQYYFKGEVDTFYGASGNGGAHCSWYFKPAQSGGERFEVYRCSKAVYSNWENTDIWKGAIVTVHGYFSKYGEQYETNNPVLDMIEGIPPAPPIDIEVTVSEALAVGKTLSDNDFTWDNYVVTGYVVMKNGSNYWLSDTKEASENLTDMFELYNVSSDIRSSLEKTSKVKVKTRLGNYRGQVESADFITASNLEVLEEGTPWN